MLILQILGAWTTASIILTIALSWGATRLKRCKPGNKVWDE